MKNFLLTLCLFLLIFIHTLDMELTIIYVGNEWQNETFPLMRYCIKNFGIYNAVWISRTIMYLSFYFYWIKRNNEYIQTFMVFGMILYWVSMLSWLFTLGIIPLHIFEGNFHGFKIN